MVKVVFSAALVTSGLLICAALGVAQNDSTAKPAAQDGGDLATGWALVKEGEADGTIEQDAQHPARPDAKVLRIAVTKTAAPGKGRAGAINSTSINVHEGQWLDVTFSAVTQRGSVGLVFSLEAPDGKVLARTTLPEIGRGGRGRAGGPAAGPSWSMNSMSLHARGGDANAHLVVTPIEATTVWLDGVTVSPRKVVQ